MRDSLGALDASSRSCCCVMQELRKQNGFYTEEEAEANPEGRGRKRLTPETCCLKKQQTAINISATENRKKDYS